jgi:hypothetical protein
MRRLCQLAVLASLLLPAATAFSENSKYRIMGVGNESCGAWMEGRAYMSVLRSGSVKGSSDNNLRMLSWTHWLAGYITAYNRFGPGSADVAKGTDLEGLLRWLDTYCEQHPLDHFAAALEVLVSELNSRAAR